MRGAASPPHPPAAFKKAGENWLENFFGFPAEGAGPPLIGSGGLVMFMGSRGGKGLADGSFGRWKIVTAPGGGGRAQRAQRRGGGPWPPPLRWFCGPGGPAKRRRPPAPPPGNPSSPPPAHFRRPPGGCSWEAGRSGRPCGGAAAFGGRGAAPGPPPGLPNKKRGLEAKPPAPRFSGRFASCRRPPSGCSTNAKKAT